MKKINILYLIVSFRSGGTQRQLVELLKNLNKERYEPIVACFEKQGNFLKDIQKMDIPIVEIKHSGKLFKPQVIKVIFCLSRLLKKEKISILHAFLSHPYVLGTLAAKIVGTPIVIMSERNVDIYPKRRHWLAGHITQMLVNKIIVNAEAIKKYLMGQHGTKDEKFSVIYNGVNLDRFNLQIDMAEKRKRLGLLSEFPTIGILASLSEKKDHHTFLKAVGLMVKKIPSMQALIIGEGPLREKLQNMARQLGVGKNVKFLGNREDIPGILALLDILVLSSVREGFPNAILEAMAAGKPVVATDVGGCRELVQHGKTGYLVPPKRPDLLLDAIEKMLVDKEKAIEMGAMGRNWVLGNHSSSKMAYETEKVYEDLIRSKIPYLH